MPVQSQLHKRVATGGRGCASFSGTRRADSLAQVRRPTAPSTSCSPATRHLVRPRFPPPGRRARFRARPGPSRSILGPPASPQRGGLPRRPPRLPRRRLGHGGVGRLLPARTLWLRIPAPPRSRSFPPRPRRLPLQAPQAGQRLAQAGHGAHGLPGVSQSPASWQRQGRSRRLLSAASRARRTTTVRPRRRPRPMPRMLECVSCRINIIFLIRINANKFSSGFSEDCCRCDTWARVEWSFGIF